MVLMGALGLLGAALLVPIVLDSAALLAATMLRTRIEHVPRVMEVAVLLDALVS